MRCTYNWEKEYIETNAKRYGCSSAEEFVRKYHHEPWKYPYQPMHNVTRKDMWNKLGQLEDIEEELEIDLGKVCLFALNGGYYKTESPLAIPTHISPTDIDVDFFFKYFNCYDSCISLYFKDYGKTWALTKEELL